MSICDCQQSKVERLFDIYQSYLKHPFEGEFTDLPDEQQQAWIGVLCKKAKAKEVSIQTEPESKRVKVNKTKKSNKL